MVHEGTWTLPRIVGSAKAREIYLMNRKLSSGEAKNMNLVTDIFPSESFMDEVLTIAKEMAAAPPLALKRIKQNLNDADAQVVHAMVIFELPTALLIAVLQMNFSAALDNEAERHARAAFHPDAAEAGLAFMQKRKPSFVGVGKRKPWEYSKL
jgi:2-(1,2-epoxy-1,2-dihydrophenyl)acetyl-CoA isomerase